MNLYYTGLNTKNLSTNIYINVSFITDSNQLQEVSSYAAIDSNIQDMSLFTTDLIEYENTNNNGRRKDTHINYGVIVRFLLDKSYSDKEVKTLSQAIGKHYNNLPYYSYLTQTGKANYLNVYISERYYSIDGGIEEQVKASKNLYKNKEGKYCKVNSKGAYLYKKKGEILKVRTGKFSIKTRYFRSKNKSIFIKKINDLKVWYAAACERLLKSAIKTTITFKRYVLKTLSYKHKHNAKRWIKAFTNCEDRFYRAYESMTLGERERLSKEIKTEMDNLYISINTIIKNNYDYYKDNSKQLKRFNYKKVKFYIDFTDTKGTKENTKLLISLFTDRLDNIYSKAF